MVSSMGKKSSARRQKAGKRRSAKLDVAILAYGVIPWAAVILKNRLYLLAVTSHIKGNLVTQYLGKGIVSRRWITGLSVWRLRGFVLWASGGM